jgi:hypothetical protein
MALVLAEFVDRDDIRMAEAGGGSRFANESLPNIFAVDVVAEDLNDDETVELGIACKVQGTHAALTDAVNDLILPEGRRIGHVGVETERGSAASSADYINRPLAAGRMLSQPSAHTTYDRGSIGGAERSAWRRFQI